MAWETVANIGGEGYWYTLAQIKASALNGGASVTGADASSFEVLDNDSLISVLINAVLPSSDDKVIVQYTIPNGTYNYIKLVYKKDAIPTSYSDGTAIDILQTDTESVISGIADGNTYYFVIFTDKSTSEPKFIKTTSPAKRTCYLSDLLKTTDFTHLKDYKASGTGDTDFDDIPTSDLGTDWLIRVGQEHVATLSYSNEQIIGTPQQAGTYISGYTLIPIYRKKVYNIKYKITSAIPRFANSVNLYKISNNALVEVYSRSFDTNVTDFSVDTQIPNGKIADYIVIGTVQLENNLVIKDFELYCQDV